jgi:hypothetical protein
VSAPAVDDRGEEKDSTRAWIEEHSAASVQEFACSVEATANAAEASSKGLTTDVQSRQTRMQSCMALLT